MKQLIRKLEKEKELRSDEWLRLLQGRTPQLAQFLFERARAVRQQHYGKDIYIRGLIEFTNYCKNDCYYCGIRKSNAALRRYRLSQEEILSCCREGYALGFRTFVLQGGEDVWYTQERMSGLVSAIHQEFPDCIITLSIGERPKEDYEAFYRAGARRFLLRHETADEAHYHGLHPIGMSLAYRKDCLYQLRRIGYQVGSGMMIGSPGQSEEQLVEDLLFLKELNPHMIGIGPFLPHQATPFADQPAGKLELTLFTLGLVRLMLPLSLIPATTALSTLHPDGRKLGVLAGANVVMPNLSPPENRKYYSLYDNKRCMGDEAAEGLALLRQEMAEIGYQVVFTQGNSKLPTEQEDKHEPTKHTDGRSDSY